MRGTVETLAETIGVDADGLVKTVSRYNDLCAAGADDDFGKDASMLIPVEGGPYYACKEAPACLTTVSGLKVNADSMVLDTHGEPIAGLYALGNTSGSMFDSYYPHHCQAISHGRCITFGYLVGRRLVGVERQ